VAGAYLVFAAGLGAVLFGTVGHPRHERSSGLAGRPAPLSPGGAPAVNTVPPSATETANPTETGSATNSDNPGGRPETSPAGPTPGYRQVSGPLGITTWVPADWLPPVTITTGVLQVNDPADNGPGNSGRFLRYGGTPAASADMLGDHVRYEEDFARGHPGYRRIRLAALTYHGSPAVDWEFEWVRLGTRRHVHSLYWQTGGVEYFVYASSTAARWGRTTGSYQLMVENSTP
jgi:hypothetical protein